MCKEKLAEGKTLAAKLRNLQQKNVLPDRVGEIAQLLKDHGNTAAHADDIEFDEKRIDLLIHFTQVILNYVYTIPGQLNEIKGIMKDK